ncbi:transcription initiation factor TFIID subunit 8-like [Ananas comosus]|uniref:Transcription initiation factor TFIID subunit 8 n=1 Tax=Ananas comosus TaxID=4615 RepID=A0A6P5F0N4_ANACO|nr:transcription initiation factor TFIID subunit 8-like [Ananas comosus]XP_020087023.1 transcription initiation factor TFIID subunit 8-like [Ananas comosus]
MSDGGRESGKDNQNNLNKTKPFVSDEFGRSISKIAIVQILESIGFHSSHASALDALADVAIRYIRNLGEAATFHANLSGRTDCDVSDVIQGLEDLNLSQGFSGASDVHHCLMSSGVVRDLASFVNTKEEIPFARPVPKFPIVPKPKLIPSFANVGKEPKEQNIPEWLPEFPDPHTYVHTAVWNERTADPQADKVEQVRQRRKAERSLLSLHKRLAFSGSAGFTPVGDAEMDKGKQVVGNNPFLAPPVPSGEKEVSEIAIPSEAPTNKRLSVMETFAPAIEAVQSGRVDGGVDEKRALPTNRPTVHFKIGVDRKSLVVPLSLGALDAKRDSWFLKDDEKDDKKRRAGMILKEAMENPHELAQSLKSL